MWGTMIINKRLGKHAGITAVVSIVFVSTIGTWETVVIQAVVYASRTCIVMGCHYALQ